MSRVKRQWTVETHWLRPDAPSPQGNADTYSTTESFCCNLSLREIAKRVGVSRTTLSRLLAGKPERHEDAVIERLLKVLRKEQKARDSANRQAMLRNKRPKEQWLDQIGGFRIGETGGQLNSLIKEVERLEKLLRSGRAGSEGGVDAILWRLRDLKGIYFEDHNPDDD